MFSISPLSLLRLQCSGGERVSALSLCRPMYFVVGCDTSINRYLPDKRGLCELSALAILEPLRGQPHMMTTKFSDFFDPFPPALSAF